MHVHLTHLPHPTPARKAEGPHSTPGCVAPRLGLAPRRQSCPPRGSSSPARRPWSGFPALFAVGAAGWVVALGLALSVAAPAGAQPPTATAPQPPTATAPTVTSVAVTSTPKAASDTYTVPGVIEFTVTFSEAVEVSKDRPHFEFSLGGTDTEATYWRGSGTTALRFIYKVLAGDSDDDGIWVGDQGKTIKLDSGEYIRAFNSGLDADLTHDGLGTLSGHKVDTTLSSTAPILLAAAVPSPVNGTSLVLRYYKALGGTGKPAALDSASTPAASAFTVMVAGAARSVSGVSVRGTDVTLTLASAVGVGETVTVSYVVPSTNPIQDRDGNRAGALTGQNVTNDMAPYITSVAVTSTPSTVVPDTFGVGEEVEFTVTFSAAVEVSGGLPDFRFSIGSTAIDAAYKSGSGTTTLVFGYTVQASDRGDGSIWAGRRAIRRGFREYIYAAGLDVDANLYQTNLNTSYKVDGSLDAADVTAPVLDADTPPAVNGATLVLRYDETLDRTSTPAASAFTVAVAGAARAVSGVSVRGRAVTLALASAVAPGAAVTVSYVVPSTNPVQDRLGNDAGALTDRAVTNDTRLVVASVAVTSTPRAAADTYGAGEKIEFTVTFSAAVEVSTGRPHFEFSLARTDTDAAYESGSGTTALVFAYTVRTGDTDSDGIWVGDHQRTIKLDSGEYIRALNIGPDADLTHGRLGKLGSHRIDGSLEAADGTAPVLDAGTPPAVNGASLVLTYDETLDRTSTPPASAFTVTVAGAAWPVSGVSVSGRGVTLTLASAVGIGDTVTVSYVVPATGPVQDLNGNAAGALTGRTVTNSTRPVVTSVAVTSTPRTAADTYGAGEKIEFTVTFSAAVEVSTGRPHFEFSLAKIDTDAAYESGSGTTALVFAYTVRAGDRDRDGIWVGDQDRTIKLDSGEYIRALNNGPDADLTHGRLGKLGSHRVDGSLLVDNDEEPAVVAPTITGTPETGRTLTASTGDIEAAVEGLTEASFSYQWIRQDGQDAADIEGATSKTYTLTDADHHRRVGVRVSYTDAAGNSRTAVSAWHPEAPASVRSGSLTATLERVRTREAADGYLAHVIDLKLSEAVWIRFDDMRDHAISVTNGEVLAIRRVSRSRRKFDGQSYLVSAHWQITVRSRGSSTVSLAENRACSEEGALCTPDGKRLANAPSLELTGKRLSVSVGDTTASESSGRLSFPVTLSRASQQWAVISLSTLVGSSGGTATPDVDYKRVQINTDYGFLVDPGQAYPSGVVVISPGNTTGTFNVQILEDDVDDDGETVVAEIDEAFTVRWEGRGRIRESIHELDDSASGTIENSGAIPRAWLARFGRTVASQAVDAVGARLEGGGGVALTVGGRPLAVSGEARRGAGEGNAARALEALRPLAGGPGRAPPAMTARELLLGSAFRLSAGAGAGAVAWTAWGRFATGGFDADEDGLRMDGSVTSGFLGADVGRERWLAGIALSVSDGEGGFESAQSGAGGAVESRLAAVYPYARLDLADAVQVWGLAGYGEGTLSVTHYTSPQGARDRNESDVSMRMGALGARGEVLSPEAPGGLAVAVKSDVLWVRTRSEAVAGLGGAEADVTRLRLLVEGSRRFEAGSGTLTPSLELGVRHDGGDAETGTGIEAGAGVRYAREGFSVEGSVRMLAAHEASGYEEWGASGAVRIDPGASGRGLSLTLRPTWGAASSGVARLWSHADAGGLAPEGGFGAERRLEAELGYGVGLGGNAPGVLTPYAGLSLSDGVERSWRGGARWGITSGAALALEAVRTGAARDGGAEHAVTLRGSVRW